ncbi:hypothetical protein ACHAXT_003246 [Thalassiosira profunda]
MASTILYKFRSGTNFETLPLPGTSARLLDIKQAIVKAKNMDRSASNTTLEFDLAIQNAATNEVYDDENMILPRGTRVIIRRVAAERGRGILSRMAQPGGAMAGAPSNLGLGGAPASDGFYTIRSRDRDGDDQFLDASAPAAVDESQELEALRAVTDQAGSVYGATAGGGGAVRARDPRVAGQGPPPKFAKPPPMMAGPMGRYRPNADPELRQQEAIVQPKKRATGIPRTFLNLGTTATTATEGGEGVGEEGGDLAAQLQPSAQGFQALVNRAGGQSLADASKRRDLDYALKLTATTIPDHLQCGICHGIVKNAMLVPWDTEGRPTCESCIRDGLTKNGFTCPLTGTEGVSPDDLFPNVGLRKAAEAFVNSVMEKMDSIEKQIEAEEEEEAKKRAAEEKAKEDDLLEDAGDGIVSGKKTKASKKQKKGDDDLFGGEDEFGGDVFDVAGDEPDEEDEDDAPIEPEDNKKSDKKDADDAKETSASPAANTSNDGGGKKDGNNEQSSTAPISQSSDDKEKSEGGGAASPSKASVAARQVRKEPPKRRGPPAGYVLGPAGGGGGGMASPANVGGPPPQMMGGGPPPGRGGGPGPGPPGSYSDMGRGGGRGPGGPGGPGGRFYPPGRGGGPPGRGYPTQQPYPGGGRGGPPPQGYPGGRGGYQRGPQWGDNNGGGDWNRKRPREEMGSPPGQQGGWGGRGGPPPGGRGYNPQYQGGRGGGPGRFHGGRGYDGGRGRGGWGRGGRY